MTGFPEQPAAHGGIAHGAVVLALAPAGTAPGPDDAPCPGDASGPDPIAPPSAPVHLRRRAEAAGPLAPRRLAADPQHIVVGRGGFPAGKPVEHGSGPLPGVDGRVHELAPGQVRRFPVEAPVA